MLSAAACLAHRAVPLAWTVMGRSQFTRKRRSRNDAEEQIILRLKEAFAGRPYVLAADRGFARAELFEKLQAWGIRYVIRACGNPWVEMEGWQGRLWNVRRRRGEALCYEQVRYHRARQVTVNLVVAHAEPAPEPWYLITNLPGARPVVEAYRRRAWIEQHFRDAKSRMGLDRLRMARAAGIERLLILMAIVILVAILTALQWSGRNDEQQLQLTTRKRGRSLSLFRLGLELVRTIGLPRGFARLRLTPALEAL